MLTLLHRLVFHRPLSVLLMRSPRQRVVLFQSTTDRPQCNGQRTTPTPPSQTRCGNRSKRAGRTDQPHRRRSDTRNSYKAWLVACLMKDGWALIMHVVPLTGPTGGENGAVEGHLLFLRNRLDLIRDMRWCPVPYGVENRHVAIPQLSEFYAQVPPSHR